MALLMDQEMNRPKERPLFGWAAILSCPIVVSPDVGYFRKQLSDSLGDGQVGMALDDETDSDDSGSDLTPSTGQTTPEYVTDEPAEKGCLDEKPAAPLKYRFSLLLSAGHRALAHEFCELLAGAKAGAKQQGLVELYSNEVDEADEVLNKDVYTQADLDFIPRLLHPLIVTQRVSIPTLHLYDRSDMYIRQLEMCVRLCNKSLAHVMHHTAGHALPYKPNEVKEVAAAIKKVMEKGRQRLEMY